MKNTDCVAFLRWALPRLRISWLGFRKVRKQFCKRVNQRLGELGLADVEAYRAYLESHADEWSVLDSFCRISVSRFYRDRGVFDCIRDTVLPGLAWTIGDGVLRCWSAGCASGEESYTLKIIWDFCLRDRYPGVSLQVVATDAEPNVLERARRACYAASSLKDLPREWLPAAFDRSGGLFRLKPEFREGVEFRLQDVRREVPPEDFHLILCRHLAFTYFDDELKRRTLSRIVDRLTPGGVFVAGKQEPLPYVPNELTEHGSRLGIYRERGA